MATDANILSLPPAIPPDAVIATQVNSGASITSDQNAVVAAASGLRYYGFSAMEDSGANPASFRVMHGATVGGGTMMDPITLAPGESTADWYGPEGEDAHNGISIDWISGSFKLVIKSKVVT